jgi:hypothetical protein
MAGTHCVSLQKLSVIEQLGWVIKSESQAKSGSLTAQARHAIHLKD